MSLLRSLITAALLLFAAHAAHAQSGPCVPNNGYPWPQFGCIKAADLNAEFASIIAQGGGTLISAPKPLGTGLDDRPAIQAFLTANCSKGPILFFGAYNIGYPGLVPPRNCVYGGATTWMASGSGISGWPAPTMFSTFGTWTDNLHCIINQTHDGQYVHDLTLVGTNSISPQVCGIRALNSVQWSWVNINTYRAFRGKELIGDSNQPCGDTECWTQAGQILYGSDNQDLAEGILLYQELPGESGSSSFVSDIQINGVEEENDCNATSSTRTDMAFLPSSACSGIGMYGSNSGIFMSGNFKSEDTFNNNGNGSFGLIAFNTNLLTVNTLGFDLNQQASIWLQEVYGANFTNIVSTRTEQAATACGHFRVSGNVKNLNIASSYWDNATPLFFASNFTGFAPTLTSSAFQIPLNDGISGYNGTGTNLYCSTGNTQAIFSPFVVAPANAVTVTPGNPTGTASTTGQMMGLGLVAAPNTSSITPAKTGNILVTISGNSANAAAITAKYGTGTAPANGVAFTGTSFGKTALGTTTFTITGLIPAAAVTVPVTPVWVDLDLAATSGTATVTNLAISLTEQ